MGRIVEMLVTVVQAVAVDIMGVVVLVLEDKAMMVVMEILPAPATLEVVVVDQLRQDKLFQQETPRII